MNSRQKQAVIENLIRLAVKLESFISLNDDLKVEAIALSKKINGFYEQPATGQLFLVRQYIDKLTGEL